MSEPTCPYCGAKAVLVHSSFVYRGSDYGNIWVCAHYPECDAYVGCHKGTDVPLGRLANAELREAKKRAHAAFDPLWRTGTLDRREAYFWLSWKLDIPADECHIGMFDVSQCAEVCEAVATTANPS